MYHRNWIIAAVTCIAITAYSYEGGTDHLLYLLHSTSTVLLIFAALSGGKSSFFLFISALFILGNWLKLSAHKIFDYPYVEATGTFGGTSAEWEVYYIYSIAITLSLVACKVVRDFITRREYVTRYRGRAVTKSKGFLYLSGTAVLVVYLVNGIFGFYRIGVARDVDLPFGLNAPASFIVYLGAPMLVAVLATNSVLRKKKITNTNLISVAIISVIASVTMYSRATVVIVALPIVMGLYRTFHAVTGRKQSLKPLILIIAPALVLSVALVSVVRIFIYSGAEYLDSDRVNNYFQESTGLFIDRWVGAEGMMAAVSNSRSLERFLEMLGEDPASGVYSLYQTLAGSQYLYLSDMTFLTLPGYFTILAFSGSVLVIFFGVSAMCLVGFAVEEVVKRAFPRHMALEYLVSANLAYHFSQMAFPLLLFPYVVQLGFFLAALKVYMPSDRVVLIKAT